MAGNGVDSEKVGEAAEKVKTYKEFRAAVVASLKGTEKHKCSNRDTDIIGTVYELHQYRNVVSSASRTLTMNYSLVYVGMTGTLTPTQAGNSEISKRLYSLNHCIKSVCAKHGITEKPFWRVYVFEYCTTSEYDLMKQFDKKFWINSNVGRQTADTCVYIFTITFNSDYEKDRQISFRLRPALKRTNYYFFAHVTQHHPTLIVNQDGSTLNDFSIAVADKSLEYVYNVTTSILKGDVTVLNELLQALNLKSQDEAEVEKIKASLQSLYK